jgi:hypothetical protein
MSAPLVQFTANRVRGTTVVDFDQAKLAHPPSNPMLGYLFWGVHTLEVEGYLSGAGGIGRFFLEKVSLDGVVLPQPLVNYLIENYLKKRFPTIDLDRPFRLPYSIDRLQVGRGNILVAGAAAKEL